MTAYRRLLRVSWTTHRTNTSVLQEIQPQERLLPTVQKRKLQYFGHVVRARNLCTKILEGRIDGKRRRGSPMRRWTDIKDWSNRSVAVFKVGEGQAAMETAGAQNDLRLSVTRKETSKQVDYIHSKL